MFGTGSSRGDRGFSSLTARALRLRHDNHAESGSLSTDTAKLVVASPPLPASLFVLMTGLNDARLNGGSRTARERYADALDHVLRALRQAAPAAPVLALEQPYVGDYSGYEPFHQGSDAVVDAYNATMQEVASRHPSTSIVVVDGWEVDTMIAADGVHPNDAGHRQIAQAVVRAARSGNFSPAG